MSNRRVYLNVPYAEKEAAKELGAKWDRDAKSWFILPEIQSESFNRWLKPLAQKPAIILVPRRGFGNKQKLTIELVPQTCWFSNVRSEVTSQMWDLLKKRTFQQANYRCEICGGRGNKHPVECHEVWDYNDDCYRQTLVRLIALCPACHECKHIGFANTQGRGEIAAKHLAKVNQWSNEQAMTYIEESFEIWQRRSQSNWTLDISYLELEKIEDAKLL
jgi:hypothetical protein